MSYSFEVFEKANQITTEWSGGTTTQLVIYPFDSKYNDRKFHFRISTACVELEESIFTLLPSYFRRLMILEGELRIEHEDHHSMILKPFEQDNFDGAWVTRGYGKVRDFNLILDDGYEGECNALELKKNTNEEVKLNNDFEAFYCVSGNTKISIDIQTMYLNEGDFIFFTRKDEGRVSKVIISSEEEKGGHLIKASISKKV